MKRFTLSFIFMLEYNLTCFWFSSTGARKEKKQGWGYGVKVLVSKHEDLEHLSLIHSIHVKIRVCFTNPSWGREGRRILGLADWLV